MIQYFLLANIYAAIFYGLYLLIFRNSKSHSWSRFYLLASALVALLLPFIKPVFSGLFFGKMVQPVQTVLLPEFVLNSNQSSWYASIQNVGALQITYNIICIILLVQFIYSLIRLYLFLSKQTFIQKSGYKLGVNTGAGPASFGTIIIFPDSNVNNAILQHEIAHSKLKHHFDKLLLQLVRCFAFPVLFFHLIYNELAIVHEFEADERAGIDKETYTKTLLAAHLNTVSISHLQTFFHHPLKRRIMMLHKNKTANNARKSILVAFSVITLSAVLLLQSNGIALAQDKKTQPNVTDKVFTSVEQVPEFPGGMTALQQFLADNIKYPATAKKSNTQGRVVVQFIVNLDGSITDIEVKRDIGKGCGEEAKRVVEMMPKWKPGTQNGITVKTLYILPVNFQMKG